MTNPTTQSPAPHARVHVQQDSDMGFIAEITVPGVHGAFYLHQVRGQKPCGPMLLTLPYHGSLPVPAAGSEAVDAERTAPLESYLEGIATALATATMHDARLPAEHRTDDMVIQFSVQRLRIGEMPAKISLDDLLGTFAGTLAAAEAQLRDAENAACALLALPVLPGRVALRLAAIEGILTTARRAARLAVEMLRATPRQTDSDTPPALAQPARLPGTAI